MDRPLHVQNLSRQHRTNAGCALKCLGSPVQERRAREVSHTTRWEWRQATWEGGSPLLQRLGTGVADYAHAKMLASPGF